MVSSPHPGPTRSSPAGCHGTSRTGLPAHPQAGPAVPWRGWPHPGGLWGGPHSPLQLPKSGVTMQLMVHHQTGEGGSLGALCSVPWAQSRCLDTHRPLGPAPGQPDTHVLPSVSHAHPIPKGRLPAQGILFSQTRPWRCELGREAPPGWAIRRCPEQCLGAWGGAVDGVAAQPGLTDPPHPGRGSGCWGPRWGGPSLGRVGSWSWAQDKALLASRRSPRSFSRQASGCHWAAAGSWGLPVPPGAGGLGDRAMQVRVAGVPVLPRARASERGEPVVHQLGPWST